MQVYYTVPNLGITDCCCGPCFGKGKLEHVKVGKVEIPKAAFVENTLEAPMEETVQCYICNCPVHHACGRYNKLRDASASLFTCPVCLAKGA